jgi:RES domain-containing protein
MKPQVDKAKEGRANSKGIPALYVATERNTAIAEVRPWVGAMVSVARLRLNRQIVIVDCTMDQGQLGAAILEIADFSEPLPKTPRDLERYAWSDIDDAFARPVSGSDDVADYAPTQILAEAFRHEGYSGVAYRSSLGDGLNIALFNLEDADVVRRSLVRVESVTVESWEVSDSSVVDVAEPDKE